MKILERNSNNINIATFWENCQLNKYNFDPDYQRPSDVWSISKKSFLIDTIMKNFPMPPIFLHQHIDTKTGKTVYDIIDGKQRLSTIKEFITNKIPLPDDFSSDTYGDEKLNGLFFSDLEQDEIYEWKKTFWKYELTIEYVDTDQINIVNNIFDRLNRNGEPLTAQELRNAKFHNTPFYSLVQECSNVVFWQPQLEKLERNRLEHHEFISELLFVIVENQIFASDRVAIVDELFSKYANQPDFDKDDVRKKFEQISLIIESFNLNFEKHRVYGVSHLYGIFGLAWVLKRRNITIDKIDEKLELFFSLLRDKADNLNTREYQLSMDAGTKSRARRVRRINALLTFLGQETIQ